MLAEMDFTHIGVAITSFVCAGIGSYLGSYLKKKGENLATHEDLDKLVDQVALVTQTTKLIEAAISGDVWDRQKRWELKREVLLEAARRMAEVDDALLSLHSVHKFVSQPEGPDWEQKKSNAQQRWNRASTVFQETRVLVEIVCGREAKVAFEQFDSLGTNIFVKIGKGDFEAYSNSKTDYLKSLLAARAAIRKELGIEGTAALEHNESSVIPSLRSQSLREN
jgi:hypothetical protein